MNNKIPLRALAESMAEKANVSPSEAQSFIKGVFQHVVEALYSGEEVEIDSFGKFSTVNSLTDPVRFTPCEEFVDEMNAPFALFAPIEIHDAESIDSIMAVEEEEILSEETEPEEVKAEPEVVVNIPDAKEEVSPESDFVTTAYEPVAVDTEPVVEVYTPAEETSAQQYEVDVAEVSEVLSPDVPATVESVEPEESNIGESSSLEETHLPTDLPDLPEENESAEQSELPELPETPEVTMQGVVTDLNDNADLEERALEVSSSQKSYFEPTIIPESEEQTHEYYVQKSSRFGLGFFLGLIVGLLIGAIALACYAIYFVNTGLSLF